MSIFLQPLNLACMNSKYKNKESLFTIEEISYFSVFF